MHFDNQTRDCFDFLGRQKTNLLVMYKLVDQKKREEGMHLSRMSKNDAYGNGHTCRSREEGRGMHVFWQSNKGPFSFFWGMSKKDTFGNGQTGRGKEESRANAFWQSNQSGTIFIFFGCRKRTLLEMDKLVDQNKSQEEMNFGNQIRDHFQFVWLSKTDTFGNGQTGR